MYQFGSEMPAARRLKGRMLGDQNGTHSFNSQCDVSSFHQVVQANQAVVNFFGSKLLSQMLVLHA